MGVSVFTDGRDWSLCLLHNIKLVVKNSSTDPPPLANGLSCSFRMASCVLYVMFCMKPYSPEVWGRLASSRSTQVLQEKVYPQKASAWRFSRQIRISGNLHFRLGQVRHNVIQILPPFEGTSGGRWTTSRWRKWRQFLSCSKWVWLWVNS